MFPLQFKDDYVLLAKILMKILYERKRYILSREVTHFSFTFGKRDNVQILKKKTIIVPFYSSRTIELKVNFRRVLFR